MSQLNRIWTAEGLVTPLHDALIYKNTKGRADSSWDIWWYLRYSTVDFMRFGHWIPGISSRRSQCWPKDFVSQKLVQYQADVWKYFPSLWCKVVVSNTFSLIGWCRMTFHLDPKDSSTPRHRRLVRWRSSMAKDLLKDLWAIRLSRQKTSNNARHECHYEAQTRYVCWQIQKLFAFSRCTIYHQSVLQAVFKRVLSCALLHLPVELLALEELVVATAVQELSLSTFDGLLGLGLPGIAHVQQDLWNISKNTMQMVTGYHMVSYSIIWSDHMTMGLKSLASAGFSTITDESRIRQWSPLLFLLVFISASCLPPLSLRWSSKCHKAAQWGTDGMRSEQKRHHKSRNLKKPMQPGNRIFCPLWTLLRCAATGIQDWIILGRSWTAMKLRSSWGRNRSSYKKRCPALGSVGISVHVLSTQWFSDFWKTSSSFSWGISLPRSQVCSSDSGSILAYLDVGGKRLVVGFRDYLLQWNSCLAGLRQMTVSWIFWTNSDVDDIW